LRGIQNNLAKFNELGIRPVAISVDAPDISKKLREDSGFTFTFLSDPNTDAIKKFDLVHAGAGESGHDIARPAEFLIDTAGTVRWLNLTENFFVRAKPEEILEAARALPQ
jgi:peroxiredoxin